MSQVAPRQPQDEPAAAAAVAAAKAATSAAAKHARSAHSVVVARTEDVAYTKLSRSRRRCHTKSPKTTTATMLRCCCCFYCCLCRRWLRDNEIENLAHNWSYYKHTHTGTPAHAYTREERRALRLSPLMSAPNVVLWFLSRRRVLLRLRLRPL